MVVLIVIFGIIIIVGVLFAIKGMKVISQSETMVIERFGRFCRILPAGINIVWPFIDRPKNITWRVENINDGGHIDSQVIRTARIDLREGIHEFEGCGVVTCDNISVAVDIMLTIEIVDARKAAYGVSDLFDAVRMVTESSVQNVLETISLDEARASRDKIGCSAGAAIAERVGEWGIAVKRAEIRGITAMEDLKKGLERRTKQTEKRELALFEAETDRQARILDADGFKKGEIAKAEGVKEALIIKAEGEAEARLRMVQAEAEAVRTVMGTVKKSGGDSVRYLIALKYIEAMREMVSGKDNKVVYLPYEATALLGSVSSIRELFETAKPLKE